MRTRPKSKENKKIKKFNLRIQYLNTWKKKGLWSKRRLNYYKELLKLNFDGPFCHEYTFQIWYHSSKTVDYKFNVYYSFTKRIEDTTVFDFILPSRRNYTIKSRLHKRLEFETLFWDYPKIFTESSLLIPDTNNKLWL